MPRDDDERDGRDQHGARGVDGDPGSGRRRGAATSAASEE